MKQILFRHIPITPFVWLFGVLWKIYWNCQEAVTFKIFSCERERPGWETVGVRSAECYLWLCWWVAVTWGMSFILKWGHPFRSFWCWQLMVLSPVKGDDKKEKSIEVNKWKGDRKWRNRKKDWVGLLGGGDRIERKVEKLTFIENLLCASYCEIMIMWFLRSILYMLSNFISVPTSQDSDSCLHVTSNEENELRWAIIYPKSYF